MIATALNGSTFQWSPTSDGLAGKASLVTNAPTASKFSLVSTPDRHLILFGTEKTVGTASSQDPLLYVFHHKKILILTNHGPRTLQGHFVYKMDLRLSVLIKHVVKF